MARTYTQRHSTNTLVKASQALLDTPGMETRKWHKKGNFQRLVTRAKNGNGNLDHARAVMIRRLNNVLGFNA
mgnify:FL=1